MGTKNGRVVVIGASMAGILTARVMADVAREVLIVERDTLTNTPEARKGVPQGRHAHALLRAGQLIVADLFPGLIEELVGRGAQRLLCLASGLWWQFDGYRDRNGDDFELIMFTRPFLEDVLPDSSLAQTTFVPSRKAESQLPLGGTRADQDRTNALLRKSCEGRFEIATGIHLNKLQAQRACRSLQACDSGFGKPGVHEDAEHGSVR
jgi:hypothetical protein